MRHLLFALLLILPTAAHAQDPHAEHIRLQGELRKLAQKTAWGGVDRTYKAMVELEIPLSGNDHLIAAQASIAEGDALKALLRLQRVVTAPVDPEDPEAAASIKEAESALNRLATRYGPVSVSVGTGRDPSLIRPAAPFAPDERLAVQKATERVAQERSFRGLLPVGGYVLDGVSFEVVAGTEWQAVVLASRKQ